MFSYFDILIGNADITDIVIVLLLFALITVISLIIDRRIFIVSSLIYILYALATRLKNYAFISYGFAITGILLGVMLLLLSAFWHNSRAGMVKRLPPYIQQRVPQLNN